MKKINFKLLSKSSIFALLLITSACDTDDLEPTLAQNKSVETSITNVDNLYGILKGAMNRLTNSGYWGREMIALNEVRSDNAFSNGNSGRYTTQGEFNYSVIALANIIIQTDATNLEGSQAAASHYKGSAHFLRALAHYDLLRTYGQQHAGGTLGVPIVTTFKGDDLFPARSSVSEVKAAIMNDLSTAFDLMDTEYDDKALISKFAAPALASRVAIYFGDWTTASTNAALVINSGLYSIIAADDFVNSFATTKNVNSIFELAFSQTDNLGGNSLGYIYKFAPGGTGYGDVQPMQTVEALYETGDVRAGILGYQGTKLTNLKKYPDINGWDNVPVIRYEEVVLNYAEALLRNGNASAATTQLNSLQTARGASNTPATVDNIMLERHRWDDLMRSGSDIIYHGTLENVLGTLTYPNNLFAYPITVDEINANSNIVQNSGY